MGGPTQDIDGMYIIFLLAFIIILLYIYIVVENFLILRGILKPTELIKEKKDKETFFLTN